MNEKLDGGLLVLGLVLIGLSVALERYLPNTQLAPPVLTALGGGLIGTTVPGVLKIRIKGLRAVGGLALVVLFFLWGGTENRKKPDIHEAPLDAHPAGSTRTNSPECTGNNCTQIMTIDQRHQ